MTRALRLLALLAPSLAFAWWGDGGGVADVSAPTSASCSVVPSTIPPGGSTTLSCTGAGGMGAGCWFDQGVGAVPSCSTSVSPAGSAGATVTYNGWRINSAGSATNSATVTLSSVPVISSFSLDPASGAASSSRTVQCSVTGATSLTLTPGSIAVTCGSTTVSPASTTTYTLTATNASGDSTATATATVTGGGLALDSTFNGATPATGFASKVSTLSISGISGAAGAPHCVAFVALTGWQDGTAVSSVTTSPTSTTWSQRCHAENAGGGLGRVEIWCSDGADAISSQTLTVNWSPSQYAAIVPIGFTGGVVGNTHTDASSGGVLFSTVTAAGAGSYIIAAALDITQGRAATPASNTTSVYRATVTDPGVGDRTFAVFRTTSATAGAGAVTIGDTDTTYYDNVISCGIEVHP